MLKRTKGLSKGSKRLQSRGKLHSKTKTQEQKEIEQMTKNADKRFYGHLWALRGPYSEISSKFLGSGTNKACIHHILSKNKYPIYRYQEDNCILLTIDEHSMVENDPTKYPEVNKRREIMKEKYGI